MFDSTYHAEDDTLEWDALHAVVQQELSSDSRQRLATLDPQCLAQLRTATAGGRGAWSSCASPCCNG